MLEVSKHSTTADEVNGKLIKKVHTYGFNQRKYILQDCKTHRANLLFNNTFLTSCQLEKNSLYWCQKGALSFASNQSLPSRCTSQECDL